ncbi:IclR family transcriptional regulator domain-containing protein [Mycetocola miduiensis]|uniref:IclR family transcriptional regulator, KDG regulon repressor n=1 Tax=Mycetocola miduiensis TaxID=995034 RepID=A0A1I4YE49_9MICO|nr:IclR family transcriptional regulator C-terminal domain-containing protein [Mycetocola miduiensis]SFN36053.1 IclR family transcriptional regulator, KDG regulon repressor [Mycetocola miduiensis]
MPVGAPVSDPFAPEQRRKAFVDELNQIAAEGISESDSEVDDGIWAIAAPITVDGTVVASLSIAGPSFRSDEKSRSDHRAVVRRAAAEISESLLPSAL